MRSALIQRGFTLIELAIVLVVVGLILGMIFKGRDLIDSARVKNLNAQYNKIQTAFDIYHAKYGVYPGDGCATVLNGNERICTTLPQDGLLTTDVERLSAFAVLQNAGILTAADLRSVFGQPWGILFENNINYLSLVDSRGAAQNSADVRYVCILDQQIDDGNPDTGIVRYGTENTAEVNRSAQTPIDCWARKGQVSIRLELLR